VRVEDALLGCLVAFVVAAALTRPVAALARRAGIVDVPRARGLAEEATPLLGGLAIYAGFAVAALLFLPSTDRWQAVLAGATVITIVGAIDDWRDISPVWKLSGQLIAALILVLNGVVVQTFTLPFIGRVVLGEVAEPATLLGLVAIMNAVNFTDGVDGLAAGVCAISSVAFCVIAFDLGRDSAAILALITGGAAAGFLVHNFHPAAVFMGDCGSNLLGLLLGATIVEGTLKTNALIALIGPLVILAVPFLDTTFVVLKRMKYGRPVYRADANHFHHRFARIGYSQRRTVAYLYAWTATMAGLAVALRFLPYSDGHGNFRLGWSLLMGALLLLSLAASVYLVYVLEILKLKRWRMRTADPGTAEHEIDARLDRDLETGEFGALG
jgi:UDP-GlcNAc:undecaprenyl-phosphate/decaprenyl-phosphate GlcNAc-1-phosphate transferase